MAELSNVSPIHHRSPPRVAADGDVLDDGAHAAELLAALTSDAPEAMLDVLIEDFKATHSRHSTSAPVSKHGTPRRAAPAVPAAPHTADLGAGRREGSLARGTTGTVRAVGLSGDLAVSPASGGNNPTPRRDAFERTDNDVAHLQPTPATAPRRRPPPPPTPSDAGHPAEAPALPGIPSPNDDDERDSVPRRRPPAPPQVAFMAPAEHSEPNSATVPPQRGMSTATNLFSRSTTAAVSPSPTMPEDMPSVQQEKGAYRQQQQLALQQQQQHYEVHQHQQQQYEHSAEYEQHHVHHTAVRGAALMPPVPMLPLGDTTPPRPVTPRVMRSPSAYSDGLVETQRRPPQRLLPPPPSPGAEASLPNDMVVELADAPLLEAPPPRQADYGIVYSQPASAAPSAAPQRAPPRVLFAPPPDTPVLPAAAGQQTAVWGASRAPAHRGVGSPYTTTGSSYSDYTSDSDYTSSDWDEEEEEEEEAAYRAAQQRRRAAGAVAAQHPQGRGQGYAPQQQQQQQRSARGGGPSAAAPARVVAQKQPGNAAAAAGTPRLQPAKAPQQHPQQLQQARPQQRRPQLLQQQQQQQQQRQLNTSAPIVRQQQQQAPPAALDRSAPLPRAAANSSISAAPSRQGSQQAAAPRVVQLTPRGAAGVHPAAKRPHAASQSTAPASQPASRAVSTRSERRIVVVAPPQPGETGFAAVSLPTSRAPSTLAVASTQTSPTPNRPLPQSSPPSPTKPLPTGPPSPPRAASPRPAVPPPPADVVVPRKQEKVKAGGGCCGS